MIFIITIERLNSANVGTYDSLLFDLFIKEINISSTEIIAFGAKYNNIPCGAILAEIRNDNIKECYIKSFVVSPILREKGVGSKLLEGLKNEVTNLKVKKVIFEAITSKENIDLLNNFLIKRGFKEAELLTVVYRFTPELLIKENKFIRLVTSSTFKLPDKVSILPFYKVKDDLIKKVKEKQGINYPDKLSPFANEFNLKEECTRFAVFDDKEIIAWMTGFKAPGDIILYRSLFVREDYRKSALGYFIFSECIKNHKKNYMDKKGLCAIALDNDVAIKFVSLYFNNMYDHKKYEFRIEMNL